MDKTIREWFKELPTPQRGQAMRNTKDSKLAKIAPSLTTALIQAFDWIRTKEGQEYWNELHNEVLKRSKTKKNEDKKRVANDFTLPF